MFTFLILLATVISTALLSIFTGVIQHWYDFYFVILYFIASFAAASVLFVLILFIASLFMRIPMTDEPNEKYSKKARFVMDEFLNTLCWYARAKIIVRNGDLLPEDSRFLMVCNHLSDFDPLVTNAVFKGKEISWVAKHTLFNVPIAGAFIYHCNFLPMHRDDLRQSLRMINKAAEYIKNDTVSIGIYPEGTRNTTEELLLPFKPGALKIAQKASVPIVVMTVANTQYIKKRFPFRSTRVYLDVLKVYSTEEVAAKTTNDLTAEIEEMMKASLIEANKRKI